MGAGHSFTSPEQASAALFKALDKRDVRSLQQILQCKSPELKTFINLPNKDHKDQTPLLLAIGTNDTLAIAELVKAGANLSAVSVTGGSPLHQAIKKKNIPAAEILINHSESAELNYKHGGKTVLYMIVENGLASLVPVAVARGANAEISDGSGRTPLHLAVELGLEDLVEALLKSGARVNVSNSEGATPLHAWARFQHSKQSLGDRLVQAGAHEQWRDFSGRTPRQLLPSSASVSLPAKTEEAGVAIQICSDLHIEFYESPKPREFVKPSAPYLALLGDIGVIAAPAYEKFLLEVADLYQTVFLVLGNHEFYKNTSMAESYETVRTICAKRPDKLVFMYKNSVMLAGGKVRVIGTTLWSEGEAKHSKDVESHLADYLHIRLQGEDRIRVTDTVAWHRDELAYVEQQLAQARDANQTVVILTHHSPLVDKGTADPEYYFSEASGGFSSNLERLMGPPVAAWCYGHTHWYNDVDVRGTRVLSNPKGYPFKTAPYHDDMVLRV